MAGSAGMTTQGDAISIVTPAKAGVRIKAAKGDRDTRFPTF
jgi:hypothetical protein